MKPAAPHVIVALSCKLPSYGNLAELVRKHYSPQVPEPAASIDNDELSASGILIQLAEDLLQDSGLKHIPKNTAIFLAIPAGPLLSTELLKSLQEHFQSNYASDLTIMLYEDSQESITEALNWLDRAECELAFMLAMDNIESGNSAAGVLIASANAAKSNRLKPYACIQQASQQGPEKLEAASVNLLEVCNKEWFESSAAASSFAEYRNAQLKENSNPFNDRICFASSLAYQATGSEEIRTVLGLITTSLALHLRVIPKSAKSLMLGKLENLVESDEARTWIHPISPVEPAHPRRALLVSEKLEWVLSEQGNDIDKPALKKLREQTTELFVFSGESVGDLVERLGQFRETVFQEAGNSLICELAYKKNVLDPNMSRRATSAPRGEQDGAAPMKMGIVAATIPELIQYIDDAILHLQSAGEHPTQPVNSASGIYYRAAAAQSPGKLAFLLPGLGASYPQMLQDLCFYFPEVRQVFDFVERMALRAGDKIVPSRAIFPIAAARQAGSSLAMLATMDSAVVTLLLVEWAMFALLKKLGVNADVFIGCSTGEFGAIAMGEVVNIIEAAETFYRLSTEVSRSIPLASLANLRSVRVAASYEKVIAPILAALEKPVYVGADLSETCVLLSGAKQDMEEFCAVLRKQNVDYLILPVAIPYHTPLVAGKVSDADADVQALNMSAAQHEAWSCSSVSLYPQDSAALRKISTDLFEKPIQLRSTLLKCYENGSRIFVEVGPKGGLVPFVSEVLKDKEHLAIAANLQTRTGIDQFHAMLAQLAIYGIDLDLEFLYKRRVDKDAFARPPVQPMPGESLQMSDSLYAFMDWSHSNPDSLVSDLVDPQEILQGFQRQAPFNPQQLLDLQSLLSPENPLNLHSMISPEDLVMDPNAAGVDWNIFDQTGLNNEVMLTYLSTMQQFHASLMNTQEKMMMAYLQAAEEELLAREFESVAIPGDFAFLPDPAVQSHEDSFRIEFCLSTIRHPFLLDHAIGGHTNSSSESSKVYLLPLMVALEIMAEGATLVFPQLRITKLSDVRAFKRIQVEQSDLHLYLELRVSKDNFVEARICSKETEQEESIPLASCNLEFAHERPQSPEPWQFSFTDARDSKLSPQHLYERGSMFHGPRMQSVCSIDRVSKRQIEGKLHCRIPEDWFAGQKPGSMPNMVTNPLLIDNASQFVLYQMYEHDLPAIALLPFHIDSIEFFAGYEDHYGKILKASAQLLSMNSRGTEARVELQDPDGNVILRVNEVSSRAIILPSAIDDFIHDPAQLVCKSIALEGFENTIIAGLDKTVLAEDETTLDWISDYLLRPSEQNEWRKLGRSAKRRQDWLSGRIAAKDAIRMYLKKHFDIDAKPADIEIGTTAAGYAELLSVDLPSGTPSSTPMIQISISHCQSYAAAIAEAAQSHRLSGIDVEDIVEREEGFTDLSFTKSEREWLASKPKVDEAKYISLLWSAKEATAKACGTGLMGNPKFFELESEADDMLRIKCSEKAGAAAKESGNIYTCKVFADQEKKLSLAFVIDSQEKD